MKTRAAILVEQKAPLELDEVEIPPLEYGQVLVEMEVTRICGSQLGEIAGVKWRFALFVCGGCLG